MAANPTSSQGRGTRSTASARNATEWFRQLEHLVHTARTMGASCIHVEQQRERLAESFASLVEYHAPLVLRVTPLEIWLRDELVLRASEGPLDGDIMERRLPFLFYRDGLRGITVDSTATREDARTLIDAIVRTVTTPASDEDLVTLLWAADLDGLQVEVAPLDAPTVHQAGDDESESPDPVIDDFDTSADPTPADALAAWRALQGEAPAELADLRAAWAAQHASCWPERLEHFVARVLAHDDGPIARGSLTRALTSWLSWATQRNDWSDATLAWEAIRRVDPERQWCDAHAAAALAALDTAVIADRLDEAEHDTLARFFTLAVRVGRPALDMVVRVLGHSSRQRVRAAATGALCYICAEDPRPLAPYLRDTRWHVARNVVFALGQVGGEQTGTLLASALRHPDVRVRRAAVSALGQVPLHRRTPLLMQQLDARDGATLAGVLAMLTREPDPRATLALVERVASADFESRTSEERVAMIMTVGEIANDGVLPLLERMLNAGGWFARRTPERDAVALAIARIGTPAAIEILTAGLRSRAEAVRTACQQALDNSHKAAS